MAPEGRSAMGRLASHPRDDTDLIPPTPHHAASRSPCSVARKSRASLHGAKILRRCRAEFERTSEFTSV